MNRNVTIGLLFAFAIALGLRLPSLDRRPMHNDEAVNAIKFGQLWERATYKYDPNEHHGPSLYYVTLALARLTRAPGFEHFTEKRLRLVAVIFGVGLLLLLGLTLDALGRQATIWAAIFTAVSPAMVFYSDYYIHEMLLVFFSFLALGSGWRYWRSRKVGWALLAGAAVGLMDATKETFVITLAAAGVALALNQIWNRILDASGRPVKAPAIHPGHLAAGLGVWLMVALLLFSSFLTNASGFLDSIRTYSPWLHRAAGDSPHSHPWHFYFQRLLFFHVAKGPIWSEALIAVLALVAVVAGFLRKGLAGANASFVRFLSFYAVLLAAAYSVIAYKTPWCLLGFWHGFILLAGVGAAILIQASRYQWATLAMSILLLAAAGSLPPPASEGRPDSARPPRNPLMRRPNPPRIP